MRAAMAEAAVQFDLPCFAYARMPSQYKQPVTLISTYPVRWTDHYLKSHYETLDPVIRAAHQSVEPFEWGEGTARFALTDNQRDFFDEAFSFGIRCGFTIPINDRRGPIAAVTFASDARREPFIRSIKTNGRALQLMAISLHAHIRRNLYDRTKVAGVELKSREVECLQWAACGKTASESAQIIGITERTVYFHLTNARTKLGVTSMRQAIALYVSARTQH